MIVGTAVLAVALLAAASREHGWRDDFDSGQLNPRWTWQVPVPGPTLKFGPRAGGLRLSIPQTVWGFNHWTNEQHAAFLRTPVSAGDWDLSARVNLVEWKPDSNLHLALVVGFSDRKVLAWGPFLSRALYPDWPAPGLWAEPTGVGAYIRARVPPRDVELRISKRVDTYTCRYRPAGQSQWINAGSWYGGGLTPRFVGLMGKSFGANPAGTLDIDYVAFAPYLPQPTPPPLGVAVTVKPGEGEEKIPPYQRGAFLEMLGHCVFQGIWDERLTNRKFSGMAEDSGVVWAWQPLGQAKKRAADRRVFLAEPQSQRIELGTEQAGIQQTGIALERKRAYRVRVTACIEGAVKRIQLALRKGNKIIGRHEFVVHAPGWQSYSCEMTPTTDAAPGAFSVTAAGPGILWIGAASLMPADNTEGFRTDLLETTRMAPPPMIRWPGGNMASGYHWEDGVGNPDRRPMRWDRAWKAWVYNDMGTDEFMAYCRLLGTEPCICVNAGEGTPEEAARWVEYCNGGPDTPMGRLRAANGHPQPYNVRYWDVGNEIWGPWQLGHVGPEVYGLRAVEFARAMRRVSPHIVLIASGVLRNDFDGWNRKMLPVCGEFMDMLSVHDYVEYDLRRCTDETWEKVVGAPIRIEAALRDTVRIAREAAGKVLPLAFDEWNSIPHPQGNRGGEGLPEAVYAAGVLHTMRRCGEMVPIGNYALLVNPIGALRTTPTQVIQTPVFLVFRLFAAHTGTLDVPVAVEAPTFGQVPVLDAAASLSGDRRTLHLTLINRHPRRALRVRWQVPGVKRGATVRISTLSGPEPWARNTAEHPNTVQMKSVSTTWEELMSRGLPPASITGLSVSLD